MLHYKYKDNLRVVLELPRGRNVEFVGGELYIDNSNDADLEKDIEATKSYQRGEITKVSSDSKEPISTNRRFQVTSGVTGTNLKTAKGDIK